MEPALPLVRAIILLACLSTAALAQGDLRGHGGPVRALSIAPAGDMAISGSFDQSAIVWSLAQGRARAILRGHEGSVNAVLALTGEFVTAGEDGKVIVWTQTGEISVQAKLHDAPVSSLAVRPDGKLFASAGWDGVVKSWPSPQGETKSFTGHNGIVNAVAFSADGRSLVSGGYDATVRIWPLDGGMPVTANLASPVGTLAITRDGVIVAGCADGSLAFLDAQGKLLTTVSATETPVTSLAASPDGAILAAGSPRGAVAIVDVSQRRVRFTLNGPGLPVWSLAFTPDGKFILSGGADRVVRRWDASTGEHVGAIAGAGEDDELAAFAHMPGADVFKACAVCHTLRPDGAGRAGPTLHGIFGRKAGSVPGYAYSPAFRNLDIVWTPETVSKLFELGPQAYTPGTKMPEQTLGNAGERQALMEFLRAAAMPK